jgi:hypothetical protein
VSESLKAILGAPGAAGKPRKYQNQPCEADGYRFDSQKERDRYWTLKQLQAAGDICCLEVHPRFQLVVHGVDLGYYEPDFRYFEKGHHAATVEDVKSKATEKLPVFRLKAGLMWAVYGLRVRVV